MKNYIIKLMSIICTFLIFSSHCYALKGIDFAISDVKIFNDPLLYSQQEYTGNLNGILAGVNFSNHILNVSSPKPIKVVILDTGSVEHIDLTVSGGYDYVSSSQDGSSPGTNYLDRPKSKIKCSSGHGLQMAGIIGAKRNNGLGIAGIAHVDIYHGRVLVAGCDDGSPDSGFLIDLATAIIDVSDGKGVTGMPKADVISISVATESVCPKYLQESLDLAHSSGITVVVSAGNAVAGNSSFNASSYAPANCNKVIVVSADNYDGTFASSYSNYGKKIDVSVIGKRLTLKMGNDAMPYAYSFGTSGASAAVAGMVAVIKKSFPDASPSKIKESLMNSALPYSNNYGCDVRDCKTGSGHANLLLALLYLKNKQ